MKNTKNTILWITRTAVMLALLIALQYITGFIPKPFGQLVTGSCVNAVLAVTTLMVGLSAGLTVGLLSPIFAFLFNIAGQLVLIPMIMVGNAVFVTLLHFAWGKNWFRQAAAVLVAAVAKFAVLYLLVVKLVCGVLSQNLLDQGYLKPPMLKPEAIPAQFTWPQLITALIGGALAIAIVPLVRKAVKK